MHTLKSTANVPATRGSGNFKTKLLLVLLAGYGVCLVSIGII